MRLSVLCPSTGGHEANVAGWQTQAHTSPFIAVDDTIEGDDAGFLVKCQKFYAARHEEILGYLHSDLTIHESGWDCRVLEEFRDPKVGVVGFVGAARLGSPDVYRTPYSYLQLARYDVLSNLTDAEVHGRREPGTKPVAVVDSCAVFVRRSLLARVGGWPVATYPNNAHCSDLWVCAMAHRYGLRTLVVGVSCTHASGGKGQVGSRWLEEHGTDIVMHRAAHEQLYDDFRGILPIEVM